MVFFLIDWKCHIIIKSIIHTHNKLLWITLFKNINFFGIMKKGYIIVRVSIHNSNLFQQYPPLSTEVMNKYGGKYIIRGGKTDVLEGEWPVDRTTVVEFKSFESAKRCYESIEYSEAMKIRQNSTKSDLILIEGY